jgi:hypothetical protein
MYCIVQKLLNIFLEGRDARKTVNQWQQLYTFIILTNMAHLPKKKFRPNTTSYAVAPLYRTSKTTQWRTARVFPRWHSNRYKSKLIFQKLNFIVKQNCKHETELHVWTRLTSEREKGGRLRNFTKQSKSGGAGFVEKKSRRTEVLRTRAQKIYVVREVTENRNSPTCYETNLLRVTLYFSLLLILKLGKLIECLDHNISVTNIYLTVQNFPEICLQISSVLMHFRCSLSDPATWQLQKPFCFK